MWYTIKEGKHRASPLSLGIHTGKISESYEVIFDESCRYDLPGEQDDEDWNKLFGWSYGILPFKNELGKWEEAHHYYSTRVGWRYNPKIDMIEICNYHYFQGYRVIRNIRTVEIGEKAVIVHDMTNSSFNGSTLKVCKKWGYKLGLYFGGRNDITGKDNVAPHDMKVWLRKLS